VLIAVLFNRTSSGGRSVGDISNGGWRGHYQRGSTRKGAAGGAVLESFAVEAWQQRGALNIYPRIHKEMVMGVRGKFGV
jgi:hypothetical protein